MKQIALILALLSLPAFGQAVDSSQVKTKTNGGVTGDASNGLAAAPYRGTSAPSSPVTGQLWCNTSFTPCGLYQYTGSTWQAVLASASVTTQADNSSFPGSPVDGQVFFSKSPYALYIYDATASLWLYSPLPIERTQGSVTDTYTSPVITKPASAPTVAASGTAGSTSAGNYTYRVTFRNATGGETDAGPVSAVVAPGASKSVDLSSIPTGGTGTTGRVIYRSKANAEVWGPWYWVATITDNSTTTLNDGDADASLLLQAPTVNFSGAIPGAWTTLNNDGVTGAGYASGGCGTTDHGTMGCMTGQGSRTTNALNTQEYQQVRASLDLSGYGRGNYTATWRIVNQTLDGTYPFTTNPAIMGMRVGTDDGALRIIWFTSGNNSGGACSTATVTVPFTVNNHMTTCYSERTTPNAAASFANESNPFPTVNAFPYWARVVHRFNGYLQFYLSANGNDWTPLFVCTGANNADAACSLSYPTSRFDHLEFPLVGYPTSVYSQVFFEYDSFTIVPW